MKTLIISPTYNERKNIKQLVDMVIGENPELHLLIVDDNSPDGTGEKVKKLQTEYKNLFLETRPKKSGLGTAYIFGFKWALEKKYDNIIQMDADLSHNPKDLPRMVNNLQKYDLVIGSRYINDHNYSLDRMRSKGAIITSTESIIFELCETSSRKEFKSISNLIKNKKYK